MPKDIGNDYGLYLASGTAPSTPGDPTEYDLAGFATDLNKSTSRNQIDASNKDSGADSEFIPGRRTREISTTFYKDTEFEGNAGQQHIEDTINDAVGGKVYYVITNETTGDVMYFGEANPSQFDVTLNDESMIAVDATLQVTGAETDEAAS